MDRSPAEELSAKVLFEHLRKLAESRILLERLKTLWIGAQLSERLERCSDHEVANLLALMQDGLGIFTPEFTVCEEAKRRLLLSSSKTAQANRRTVRDAGAELLNAEAALYRAGLPHMLLPFQRDRFASNVFYVPDAAEARACLPRNGFRRARNFDAALLDYRTGRQIRLVEAERH